MVRHFQTTANSKPYDYAVMHAGSFTPVALIPKPQILLNMSWAGAVAPEARMRRASDFYACLLLPRGRLNLNTWTLVGPLKPWASQGAQGHGRNVSLFLISESRRDAICLLESSRLPIGRFRILGPSSMLSRLALHVVLLELGTCCFIEGSLQACCIMHCIMTSGLDYINYA
jgi:hypothetical protein